jgi:thiol-disulfide isomerase/thioredoxin
MALLLGVLLLSELLFTRVPFALIAASLLVALPGCDTEKGTASQGTEQAGTASGAAGESANARYRIDRAQVGTPIADVEARGPDGMLRSLRSLAGRPVVLNLWATWCAPCVEELPTLNQLAATHRDVAHIVVLSQDLGEADVPNAFLRERQWNMVQSWHDPENTVGLAAGGNLPTTILYDREGKEVLRVIGPLDWAGAEAGRLLAEAGIPPSPPPVR